MAKSRDESGYDDSGSRYFADVASVIVALALLYVGGWSVMWGAHLDTANAVFWNGQIHAIRINGLYYGLSLTNRFFESAFLSWMSYWAAIFIIIAPTRWLRKLL